MKKILPIALLLIFANNILSAQQLKCGVPALTTAEITRLKNIPLVSIPSLPLVFDPSSGVYKPTAAVKVKIQFFIVCDGGVNTANITPAQVNSALSVLNNKFLGANIEFEQCTGIRYVTFEPLANNFPYANTTSENALGKNDLKNTINVYIVNTITDNVGGYTYVANSNNKNKIYLASLDWQSNSTHLNNGLALSHEMGHFFGLGHTNGFSQNPGTAELVNGNNSLTAGDLVQDTPADPCYMSYSSCSTTSEGSVCTYPSPGMFQSPNTNCGPSSGYPSFCDANSQRYQPLGNNLMITEYSLSYNTLTVKQLQRIYSTYQNNFVGDFDGGADLVVRDNINDAGDQQGLYTDWASVFQSPDVWNCRTSNNCTTPEFAGYANSATTNNYMRINVTNKGCAASQAAVVHAYWTLGSTGEAWPGSWDGTTQLCGLPGGGEIKNADNTYGQSIPALAPNQQMTFTFPWKPANPNNYTCMPLLTNSNGEVSICFLGRITSTTEPMYSELNGPIQHNVTFNNNIATRNSSLVNLPGNKPGVLPSGAHIAILVQNPLPYAFAYDLHINNPDNTNYFQNGALIVGLSEGLWQAWVSGGQGATNIQVYDASKRLISITGNNAILKNVTLATNLTEVMTFAYFLKNSTTSYNKHNFVLYQTQKNNTTDSLIGSAYNFNVNIVPGTASLLDGEYVGNLVNAKDWAMLYPNPTNNNTNLIFSLNEASIVSAIIIDQVGKTVKPIFVSKQHNAGNYSQQIDLSNLSNGIYYLRITTQQQLQTIKFIIN